MIRLTVLFLFISCQLNAATYYFANSGSGGSDANSGTSGSPYATIAKLNTLSLSSGDIIYFNGGNTFVGQVTQTTGGITYTSYGTGKATISGYADLTSWTNLGSNIWSAPLNSGLYLDVVVMNGAFVMQGRSPNAGSYWNIDSRVQITGGDGDNGFTGQTLTSSSLVTNFVGGRAFIGKNVFNLDNDVITSYSGTTIGYATYNANPINNNNNKFFVQNHLATVTAQNEWYYDPVSHLLKMYSTSDPSSFGIKAGQYDFALRINNRTGTNTNGLTISNLIFQGYDSVAICLTGVNNVSITGCEIYYIGVNGISCEAAPVTGNYSTIYGDYNCNNVTTSNNIIKYCGNTGINHRFTATGVYVTYNTIDSCGVYEGMGLPNNQQRDGIQIEYAGGATGTVNNDSVIVSNNIVTHSGYCGIRWEGAKAQIRYNFIDTYGMQTTDGGGIYTSRNAGDSVTNYRRIHHNIVINSIGRSVMISGGGATGGMPGIYQDDRSVNILIDSNAVADATRDDDFIHNNRNITLQYNNFFNNNSNAAIGSEYDGLEAGYTTRGMNIQYNNIYTTGGRLLHLYSYIGSDVASYGTINNNYYARTGTSNMFLAQEGGTANNYSSLASWQAGFGYDAASTYRTVVADSMQLFYNATFATTNATFAGYTYRDLQGNNYTDYMTLKPFESKMGYKVTYAGLPNPPIIIIRNQGRKRQTIVP